MDVKLHCQECRQELAGKWSNNIGRYFVEPCEACLERARAEATEETREALS